MNEDPGCLQQRTKPSLVSLVAAIAAGGDMLHGGNVHFNEGDFRLSTFIGLKNSGTPIINMNILLVGPTW